jgi:hypothetical protein
MTSLDRGDPTVIFPGFNADDKTTRCLMVLSKLFHSLKPGVTIDLSTCIFSLKSCSSNSHIFFNGFQNTVLTHRNPPSFGLFMSIAKRISILSLIFDSSPDRLFLTAKQFGNITDTLRMTV